jgi:predicted secreted protein
MAFINGSDLLIKVAGNYLAHSSTHTTTYNTETKDRSFKPVGTVKKGSGKWKNKGVSGLSISISAEGLRTDDEVENGFATLLAAWKKGESIVVEAIEREGKDPYLKGAFIIASLEETSPAEDDATYSISLENDGEPDVFAPEDLSDYVAAAE